MKSKKIWANVAVDDLKRTTQFYTDLGFTPNGASKDLTSFLFGEDDFVIHFFIKEVLQSNINAEIADLRHGSEIVFSLSAESREEVGEWVKKVKKAGGTIFAEAREFDKGYFFGFSDPDGHKFNVLYWPG